MCNNLGMGGGGEGGGELLRCSVKLGYVCRLGCSPMFGNV